ncbi:cytidylate kinase [uncultured Desulfobacterium sp.]|uniref:Cytidylate kinase n=1 Tax=uncultured Desulfobacterium sp. TaxID=201089 RepID=A0A445MW46_9BACT|nr:cytidylate kinase [uncultured Desulfobacterium sp.]
MNTIITIDGPAGSGKSTLSRLLARRLNAVYLDTGAMYRAVALAAKRRAIRLDDAMGLKNLCGSLNLFFDSSFDPPRLFLGNEDVTLAIRSPEMDMASSEVSAVKEVRQAMTGLQRKMAERSDVVAEGRDMGSVVFPMARCKFFVTASAAERAERRYNERLGRGEPVSRERVESEMRKRDQQDQGRQLAPLKPAEGAIIIDTTDLSIEQVLEELLEHVKTACLESP